MFPIWFWIGAATIVSLAIVLFVVMASFGDADKQLQKVQSSVKQRDQEIDKLKQENEELSRENEALKETSQTLEQIKDRVYEINKRRTSLVKWAALPDRGGDWIGRIDGYLAQTPLAGQGRTFYIAAVDAGIEPRLMPAIAMIESGGGRVNANANNFFGRRASVGWRSWPTAEAAIQDQAKYTRNMWGSVASPYQMRGYAVPGGPWMGKVSREMHRI